MTEDMSQKMEQLLARLDELLADEANEPEAEGNTPTAEHKAAQNAPTYGTVRCADGSVHEIVPAA